MRPTSRIVLAFVAATFATSATATPIPSNEAPLSTDTSSSPIIQVYGSNSSPGSAFSVTVAALDGTQSQPVPVELVRASNTVLNFARLAFAGTIQVTIRVPDVTAYSLSPRRYGIATQVDAVAKTIRFTLSNDAASAMGRSIRLIVHDHYGRGAKLFLFADRQVSEPVRDGVGVFDAVQDFGVSAGSADNAATINSAIVSLSARQLSSTAILYVPAGVYSTGTIAMKNDVTLYLSGRAVLIRPSSIALDGAMIRYDGVHNAHVRGPGIINANLWHATNDKIVFMNAASGCSLEDATLTGTGNWSIHLLDCSDIVCKSYKLINELTDNSDGTDPDHSRRVTIDGVFEHTQDDAFAIKTSPGSSLATDSVTVTNAVVWTEKSALKIGSEVTRGIQHIRFSDNQVVLADRGLSVYGNGSGLAGGFVDGAEFTGNTIEKIQNLTQGKLVEFQVQYFADAAPYAPIRNVNVTDTFCYSTSPNRSTVSGVSGTPISNVHFQRFWIDDAHVMVTDAAANVGSYFSVGPSASGVSYTNDAMPLSVRIPAPGVLGIVSVAPNPARGSTSIEFDVAREATIALSVLDVTGREVAMLAEGRHRPGRYRVAWSGDSPAGKVGAGIYFVRLQCGNEAFVRRLAVVR